MGTADTGDRIQRRCQLDVGGCRRGRGRGVPDRQVDLRLEGVRLGFGIRCLLARGGHGDDAEGGTADQQVAARRASEHSPILPVRAVTA